MNKILVLDNYDSFTYNLVQRLGEMDPTLDLRVYRNDQIRPEEVETLARMYHLACQLGQPAILPAQEMDRVLRKFADYRPDAGKP